MPKSKTTFQGMLPWLALAVIIIIADQFTKTLILGYYKLGDSTTVTSFFNMVRVHNTGAAFSFLANAGGWQRWFFTGIGAVATIFIIWMLRSHHARLHFGRRDW
jgi:signal peptidase II